MIESKKDTQRLWDTVYHEVMALYAVLQGMPQTIRVRRAEMRSGEVQAEAIDFCMDVQLKAARVLESPSDYMFWLNVLHNPDNYPTLPKELMLTLGHAFLDNRLGACGDYRSLYFRVKNQTERSRGADDERDTGNNVGEA